MLAQGPARRRDTAQDIVDTDDTEPFLFLQHANNAAEQAVIAHCLAAGACEQFQAPRVRPQVRQRRTTNWTGQDQVLYPGVVEAP